LRPLHKALYNQLSRFPWLLRGEATPGKLGDFVPLPGLVFVSGDYEAATDHLPLEVAEVLLDVALRNSSYLPFHLCEAAMSSLRAKIWYEDCDVPFEQAVGQLMGNLLSFPLLCLQNYAAFRWCFPASVPVKINGDDIVFRASREEFDRWSAFVGRVGLRLSRGKTMVHSRFFSVNSSFFRAGPKLPRRVPVLRTGGLLDPLDSVGGMASALRSFCRGFRGRAQELAQVLFLRRRKRYVLCSGRSVTRGLGIAVGVPVLQSLGLWRREKWFFDTLVSEEPLPADPGRLQWSRPPEGWERVPLSNRRSVRRVQRATEDSFWSLVVADAWLTAPHRGVLIDEYFRDLRLGGHELSWRRWRDGRKRWLRICHPTVQVRDLCFLRHGRCPHSGRYWVTEEAFRRWVPPRRRVCVWAPAPEVRRETRTQFSC